MARLHMSVSMMFSAVICLLASFASAVPAPQALTASTATSSFWMAQIKRQGTIAYGNDTSYQIFRNVKDLGAKGDGTTDDTEAINNAISMGNRCGQGCDSSTTTPAIIYFPPGIYKISSPIVMLYYSQLIGDATDMPTILGGSNFQGLAMLDADPYIPNAYGAQWYTNQNNFYRQVRNFVIDMTQMPAGSVGSESNGIHWQVAQATSLQNIVFNMRSGDSSQRGIMIENGSGGFMSDLTFNNGNIGMFIGSQQFTTRNITFNNCNTAVMLIWDWLWTFKGLNINNCQTGLNMSSLSNGVNQTVGSAVVMDSVIKAKIGISSAHIANAQPKTGGTLIIHNTDFSGTPVAVGTDGGQVILAGGALVPSWGMGDAYLPQGNTARRIKRSPQQAAPAESCTVVVVTETVLVSTLPAGATAVSLTSTITVQPSAAPTSANNVTSSQHSSSSGVCTRSAIPATSTAISGPLTAPSIPANLKDATGAIFQRGKPQYEMESVASFLSVKDNGAKGDGVTDDTQAIQAILNKASTANQIVYFDHGAYVISDTVQVPKNSRIVGEIWPLIMIKGSAPAFSDSSNPKPAFRVGNPGDTGIIEISDLVFETLGPAPGAIMMEWNIADTTQGSAAMWDTHFRVGGTVGTELQQDKCLANTTESKTFRPECAGSFLMMHITQQASAYLENTWFWLADHELDMEQHNQTTIFNGRGLLVESQGPTWLWGTASEHSVFYNYQINNAQNVFMGAIQTETAYFQAAPDALQGGFTPNSAYNDPEFSDCTGESCKKTWGLRVLNSQDIYMFGGGLYSFFDDYNQDCLNTEDCQQNMVDLQCSSRVNLYGLVTKASTNMVNVNGQPVALQKDHPNLFGATVALFEQL